MSTSGQIEHAEIPSEVSPPPESVRDELRRITESSDFNATPRRRKLLAYLVEEMLAGRDHALKGYTIATDVFGRDASFDPQADPVVRLEARRLRHDLDSYYVAAGRTNPLRISIPKGAYVPAIEWSEGELASQGTTTADPPVDNGTRPAVAAVGTGSFLFNPPSRLIAGALAALVLFAVSSWVLLTYKSGEPVLETGSRGPALTVLAFATEGNGEQHKLLGSGFADQIMAGISRFGDFRFYLPPAAAEDSATRDPIAIGNRLGLSYIVDGSIVSQPQSSSIRISARLIDVRTHRILWIGTYDRSYSPRSLLAVQDEIAGSVASTLGQPYGVIRTDQSNRMPADAEPSTTSYECVLGAYAYRRGFTAERYQVVKSCLDRAVVQDPDYAEAWAMLGWLEMDAGRFGWTADGNAQAAYQRGLATASHAIALDRDNISALKALASIHHYMGRYDESERLQRQALALNPNDPDTLAQLGWRLAVRGRFDEGIPYLQQAIERTVNPPGWYYHLIVIDHYLNGRYPQMLETARMSTTDGSGISWSLVAIAEGALGHQDAARQALIRMGEISPRLERDPAAGFRRHQATDTIVETLVSGLRRAGWSEPATTATRP